MRTLFPSVLRAFTVVAVTVGLIAALTPSAGATRSWPTTPGYYGPGYRYFGPYEHRGGQSGTPDDEQALPARYVIGHDTSLYPTGADARSGEFDREYTERSWGTPSTTWKSSVWDTFPDGSVVRWDGEARYTQPVERNDRPTRLTKWSADGSLLWENHLDWLEHTDWFTGGFDQGGISDVSASADGSVSVLGRRSSQLFLAHFTASGEFNWIAPILRNEVHPLCPGAANFAGLDVGPDGSVVFALNLLHSSQDLEPGCSVMHIPNTPPPIDLNQHGYTPTYGKWENTPTTPLRTAGPLTTVVVRYSPTGQLVNSWNGISTEPNPRWGQGDLMVLPDNRVAVLNHAQNEVSLQASAGWKRVELEPGWRTVLALFEPAGEELVWETTTDGIGSVQPDRLELANDGSILMTVEARGRIGLRSADDGPVTSPEEAVRSPWPQCDAYVSVPNLGTTCFAGYSIAANYSTSGVLQWATTVGRWPDREDLFRDPASTQIVPRGDNDADLVRGEAWRMIRSSPPTPPPGAPPPPEESSLPEQKFEWTNWLFIRCAEAWGWERCRGEYAESRNQWVTWLNNSGLDPDEPPDWVEIHFDPSQPFGEPPILLLDSALWALYGNEPTDPPDDEDPTDTPDDEDPTDTSEGENPTDTTEGEDASASPTSGRSCISATPRPFNDVSPLNEAGRAVACLRHLGIANGTGNGRFTPQRAITRAEMAMFLWRIAGTPTPTVNNPFTDVPNDATYTPAARWLAETGLTTTASSGRFKPNDFVTRGQMASFLWTFAGKPAARTSPFGDVPTTQWFTTAVNWLAQRGIAKGFNGGTVYKPYDPVTREHMALFLNRLGTSYRIWTN